MNHLSPIAKCWYGLIVLLGAGAVGQASLEVFQPTANASGQGIWTILSTLSWLLLIPANGIVGLYRIRLPRRQEMISAGDVILFILAIYFGPAQATLSASFEGFIGSVRGRTIPWRSAIYNAAVLALTYYLAAHLFVFVATPLHHGHLFASSRVMLGLLGMVVTKFLLNAILILTIMVLSAPAGQRRSTLLQLLPLMRWMAATELIGTLLTGIVMVMTDLGLNLVWSVTSLIVLGGYSLLVLRHYFAQLEMQVERSALAEERASLAEATARLTLQTMKALATAIEAKDPNTLGHVQRVAAYVDALMPHLELTPDELNALKVAALLHDVGKLGISDVLLSKRGPLTELEQEKLQSHVQIGAQIASHFTVRLTGDQNDTQEISIAEIILCHHERYDGGGFPSHLRGEQIPYLSRILGALDHYDLNMFPRDPDLLVQLERAGAAGIDGALLKFQLEAGRALDPDVVMLVVRHHGALQIAARQAMPDPASNESGSRQDYAHIIANSQREDQQLFDSAHRLVGSSLKVSEVLETLTRNIDQVVPWSTIVALVLDEPSGMLEVMRVDGYKRSVLFERRGLKLSPQSAAWRAIQSRDIFLHASITVDLRNLSEELALHCPVADMFPLCDDEVLGVILVCHGDEQCLGADQIRFLESLCQLAAPALKNARHHQHEAITDGLTGLINNRYLMREGTQLMRSRIDGSLAVMMIDLDGFKAVNDKFGHETGDKILVTIARALKPLIGPGEILARKGGDEFVIILLDVDEMTAQARAEQIRNAVCEASVPVPHGEARVGASIGIAWMEANMTFETLLRIADARMYRQKRRRREAISEQPFLLDPDAPFGSGARSSLNLPF